MYNDLSSLSKVVIPNTSGPINTWTTWSSYEATPQLMSTYSKIKHKHSGISQIITMNTRLKTLLKDFWFFLLHSTDFNIIKLFRIF